MEISQAQAGLINNFTQTSASSITATVPNLSPGMYTMYVRNSAGFGTSAGQFEVTGASSPILVNWTLYVGTPTVYPTVTLYSGFAPPTSGDDRFRIVTLNGAVETDQVSIISTADTVGKTAIGGYFSGSFNYQPVDGQIKFKLIRTGFNFINEYTGISEIILSNDNGTEVIHNQLTGAPGDQGDWQYSTDTQYQVSGDWIIFTTGQLFNNGEQRTLTLTARAR